MNPEKDLLGQIQNPDLRIIAQILLQQNKKLDGIDKKLDGIDKKLDGISGMLEEIKKLMESEVWHRERYLIANKRVKPKNVKAVFKPDLDNSKKYADVVYIYEKGGKTIARIVEAKSTLNIDLESLKEKFRNTEEYVKRASKGFKVDEYEWVISLPEHLEAPEIEGVKVVRNPEGFYEDE